MLKIYLSLKKSSSILFMFLIGIIYEKVVSWDTTMFLMYLQKIHEVFILFLRSCKYTYREEIKYREMWKSIFNIINHSS